jgi:SAM-dependent methyltransferase
MFCKICKSDLQLKYSGVSDINFKMTKDIFDWYECKVCSSLQIMSRSKEENLDKYYDNYIPHKGGVKKRKLGRVSNLSIIVDQIEKFSKSGKFSLIDIGCGSGSVLYNLRLLYPDSNLCGVDYNIEESEKNLATSSVELFQGELDSIPKNIKFDFIINSQLLEHIDSPETYRSFLCRHSHVSTVVVLDIPNISSTSYKFFGKYWVHLDTPRHRVHYTVDSIKILLDNFLLKEKRFFGDNYAYTSSLKNKFNISLQSGGIVVRLVERFIVEISRLFLKVDDKVSFTFVGKER